MNPKLKKKVILVLVLVFIYFVLVINVHKIKFAFSMLDIYNQEKVKESVSNEPSNPIDENVQNPIEQILKPDTIKDSNEELDPTTSENPEIVLPLPEDTDIPTQNPTGHEINNKDILYKEILEEYNLKLDSLRLRLEENLDKLIDQGIKDLNNGEISSSKLFVKYMSEGAELEKHSDKEFEIMIDSMKNKLLEKNLDTSVIDDIRAYYLNIKNAKKQDIISRGINYID